MIRDLAASGRVSAGQPRLRSHSAPAAADGTPLAQLFSGYASYNAPPLSRAALEAALRQGPGTTFNVAECNSISNANFQFAKFVVDLVGQVAKEVMGGQAYVEHAGEAGIMWRVGPPVKCYDMKPLHPIRGMNLSSIALKDI